jgi:hypothetical protein
VTLRAKIIGGVELVLVDDVPLGVAIEVTAVNDRSLPCDLKLVARMNRGRYEVEELVCSRKKNGDEITSEMIRSLPVGKLLRWGAINANTLLASPRVDAAKIRTQGPTDESLRAVARVYRVAFAAREDPTAAVASGLQLPRPTASRWVKTARQRGFLGPTEERRAGERKRKGKS